MWRRGKKGKEYSHLTSSPCKGQKKVEKEWNLNNHKLTIILPFYHWEIRIYRHSYFQKNAEEFMWAKLPPYIAKLDISDLFFHKFVIWDDDMQLLKALMVNQILMKTRDFEIYILLPYKKLIKNSPELGEWKVRDYSSQQTYSPLGERRRLRRSELVWRMYVILDELIFCQI